MCLFIYLCFSLIVLVENIFTVVYIFEPLHSLTPNLLNFLNGVIHVPFLELSNIMFSDIKIKTRNVSIGHGCPHLCNFGRTDRRKDGRMDKGKSKCPLKWGHNQISLHMIMESLEPGQYRAWSDCTDVQVGLALYWRQRLITFNSSRIRAK